MPGRCICAHRDRAASSPAGDSSASRERPNMAGIGFVLSRLTRQDNMVGVAVGYVYAALVSSGPFLVTVIAMAAIGILGEADGGRPEHETYIGSASCRERVC